MCLSGAESGGSNADADIRLKFPSVGATECLVMAACLGEGKMTTLRNAAREPEVLSPFPLTFPLPFPSLLPFPTPAQTMRSAIAHDGEGESLSHLLWNFPRRVISQRMDVFG